jgi:hypothetical protein
MFASTAADGRITNDVNSAAAAGVPLLLPTLVSDPSGYPSGIEIGVHWSWLSVPHSCRLFDLLLRLIVSELTLRPDAGENAFARLLECYTCILVLSDSPQCITERTEYGLVELCGLLQKVIHRTKAGDQRLLASALQYLLKAAHQSKAVNAWMHAHQRKYQLWPTEYKRAHAAETAAVENHR